METSTQADLLSLHEYIRLYEQEGPFEIIDGERKPIMPPVVLHGFVVRALFLSLHQHAIGEVLTEVPFVLTYDANWVRGSRVPDVMFIAADRWAQYTAADPDWASKPVVLVPDLVAEVVSPNDLYTDLQGKVDLYRDDGVKLIWIIDPRRKRVTTYAGDRYAVLGEHDVLDAEPLMPNLKIVLKDLFHG